MEHKRGKLFILSGASGTGKTTLCRALEKQLGLFFSISATTRPKRSSEVEGHDYHFLSAQQFKEMIGRGGFLEWAQVHDHYYGTPKAPVEGSLERGEGVLLDLDTQGALQLKAERDDVVLIFIKTSSLKTLQERLEQRGTEDPEVIEKRVAKAKEEISQSGRYDYVVVNEDFNQAKEELKTIIEPYLGFKDLRG